MLLVPCETIDLLCHWKKCNKAHNLYSKISYVKKSVKTINGKKHFNVQFIFSIQEPLQVEGSVPRCVIWYLEHNGTEW